MYPLYKSRCNDGKSEEIRLPDELMFSILSQLPAKTLVQCKAVSKHWKSLIETPLFARNQFQLSNKQCQFLSSPYLLNDYESSFVLYLDRNYLFRKITTEELRGQIVPLSSRHDEFMTQKKVVLTTCDGIMCIRFTKINYLCLWNPTIDEIRYVPLPPVDICYFNFAGFGYASSINDYKVVLAIQERERKSTWVYSLRHNQWRELDFSSFRLLGSGCFTNFRRTNAIRMEAVVMNDALHWVKGPYIYNKRIEFFVYKFDLVNECFEKVVDLNKVDNLVDVDDDLNPRQTEIGVTENNRLVVYKLYSELYYSNEKRDVIKAWEMVDQHDYYSWKTKFEYRGRFDYTGDDHNLARIACNGNVLIIGENKKDYRNNQVIDLRRSDREIREAQKVAFYAPYYVPSLISPNNF